MGKAAQAGAEALGAVPVVGDALSGLLGVLIESISAQKQLKGQCDNLSDRLPVLLRYLKKVTEDADSKDRLVEDLRETVEVFNEFVQDLAETKTWDRFLIWGKRRSTARSKWKRFESELVKFTDYIKSFELSAAASGCQRPPTDHRYRW